ncbi:unnamed protein product [Schistosoma turkestanicum]|nr:unnamed protein product [Schistosoma turkestanicum]
MPELTRADRIAAAQKRLREFQAAKANKQPNEAYVNQAYFNVSGTENYQTDFVLHEDNHFTPQIDSGHSYQLEQKQEEHQAPSQHGYVSENCVNVSVNQPQLNLSLSSASSVPQSNDTVISLTDYFNNPTPYYHHPSLEPLPNNYDTDKNSVSFNENVKDVVLNDLTVHSNLTDKHQVVASSSPNPSSSAFQTPNKIINHTIPVTSNTEYLSYSMYNPSNKDNHRNDVDISANIEFNNHQDKLNSNNLTVCTTSYYHPSSESAAIYYSNQANDMHYRQSTYPKSGIKVEEEVINNINVELASMLEKRNLAYERLTVKLDSMKEQYERRLNDLTNERKNLESSSQRDLEKTKEQIRAHAKTIGVLVAEKTELQSQVTHLDNLAVQRLREIDDVNSRLKASRQQILDLERSLSDSRETVNSLQTEGNDLQNQIKCLQGEIKREKNTRQNLENELAETSSRLTAKSCELAQTGISLNELRQQLELSQIYVNQLGSTGDSLMQLEDKNYRKLYEEWLAEDVDLQNRLKELELSLSSADAEKKRMDAQYRNYVAQVEQQANDLLSQLSETNKLKQEMELSLESVSRQLREKNDEINDLTCRLNSVQIIPTSLAAVQTQLLTSSSSSAADAVTIEEQQHVNSTPSSQQQESLEQIEILENQLKCRVEELEHSNIEIHRLHSQLSLLEETIKQLQNSLADRDAVLATATSERTTLSRAVEQNKNLKQQLSDLQTAYTQMCTNYQSEIKSTNEMNYALTKQIEHLNILQMENQNQSENIISCTILSIDNATQTMNDTDIVHDHQHLTMNNSIQIKQQQQQPTENMINEESNNLNQLLKDEITSLRNLFTRISVICQWFECENGKMIDVNQCNDPVYCVNLLEESIQKLIRKHSTNLIDNSVQSPDYSMKQEELTSYMEKLQNLQVTHTQLEAKFLKCMEELSTVKEERSTLESINTQLEMEAATVEEYVILFTHRRAAAAKRAKARELLLQRLVDDRRRLRDHLKKLFSQIQPVSNGNDDSNSQTEIVEQQQQVNAKVNDSNHLENGFLNEFRSLIDEIGLSNDEKEFEAGLSDLNDEDVNDNEIENPTNNNSELVSDLTTTAKHHFTLESLRYEALRHDCPHCKCCVGTLLEV